MNLYFAIMLIFIKSSIPDNIVFHQPEALINPYDEIFNYVLKNPLANMCQVCNFKEKLTSLILVPNFTELSFEEGLDYLRKKNNSANTLFHARELVVAPEKINNEGQNHRSSENYKASSGMYTYHATNSSMGPNKPYSNPNENNNCLKLPKQQPVPYSFCYEYTCIVCLKSKQVWKLDTSASTTKYYTQINSFSPQEIPKKGLLKLNSGVSCHGFKQYKTLDMKSSESKKNNKKIILMLCGKNRLRCTKISKEELNLAVKSCLENYKNVKWNNIDTNDNDNIKTFFTQARKYVGEVLIAFFPILEKNIKNQSINQSQIRKTKSLMDLEKCTRDSLKMQNVCINNDLHIFDYITNKINTKIDENLGIPCVFTDENVIKIFEELGIDTNSMLKKYKIFHLKNQEPIKTNLNKSEELLKFRQSVYNFVATTRNKYNYICLEHTKKWVTSQRKRGLKLYVCRLEKIYDDLFVQKVMVNNDACQKEKKIIEFISELCSFINDALKCCIFSVLRYKLRKLKMHIDRCIDAGEMTKTSRSNVENNEVCVPSVDNLEMVKFVHSWKKKYHKDGSFRITSHENILYKNMWLDAFVDLSLSLYNNNNIEPNSEEKIEKE